MPGVEFLQAFAKFFVDKSEYDKGVKDLVGHAEDSAKKIEASFGEGFKRGFSRGGEALADLGQIAGKAAAIVTSPLAAAAAAGALLVEQLVVSVEKGLEFDREFTKIKVLLAGNQEASEHAREAIENVNTSLGTGVEYAGAYRRAFLNTGSAEAAEDIAKVSFALSKVGDADTIATTRLLGDLIDGLGKKSEEAGDVAGKLFYLMKSGGGDISDLGGGFLTLVDTAQTLNINFDELVGGLSRLGEVAGASPQRNIMSLNIALGALEAHKSRLLEQGIDLDDVIKTEGLIGALRVLNVVTDGNREALREFGIQGRNANAILKLIADTAEDGGAALKEKFGEAAAAGASDLTLAVEQRSKAISTQVQTLKNEITQLQEATGGGILGIGSWLQNLFAGVADKPDATLEQVSKRLEEIEAKRKFWKDQGEHGGARSQAAIELQMLAPEYEALLRRKAVMEATADVEERKRKVAEGGVDVTKDATEAERAIMAVEAARADQVQRLSDELGIAAEKIKGLGPQQLAQAEALAEASRKAFAEAGVLTEESLQKATERETQRLTSTLRMNLQIAESDRTLEQERAKVEGRSARGLEELLALRRRTIEEGAAIEIKGLDEVTASQTRAAELRIGQLREEADLIRARPGFDTNFGLRQKVVGLDTEIDKAEAALVNLQEDAANKRVALEQKTQLELAQLRQQEYAQRRAQIVEEQKLDDGRFAHRLAMGQATIQDEIDRARLLSMDPDRTAEERMKFAEQARNRERQAMREELEFRRSIGQGTLQEEINYQQALVDASRRGTQERRELEKKLAEDIKSYRQQAASAANTLFDLAASRTEKERNAGIDAEIQRIRDQQARDRGEPEPSPEEKRIRELEKAKQRPVELSPEDVTAQLDQARREAREAARIFAAGGAVTPEQFKAIGSLANIDDQLAQFGGGLAGANAALEQFARNLLVPFGQEMRNRGIDLPSRTFAETPGDSRGLGDLKAGVRAELARMLADAAEAGAAWPHDTGPLGAAAAIGRAREDQQDTTSGGFDRSGAAERARSAESFQRFQSGLAEGLDAARTGTDAEGVGRQLAQAIYQGVYDKLVTELGQEADRL